MALGLQAPWKITDVTFKTNDAARRELHLRIGFVTGSKFKDETGVDCTVHDTIERQWQHLNFFEHHCFLHCKVPRITTSEGKVRTVDVPWARAQSGFTLLFEAFALALIEREMPVTRVAQILGVHPQRNWTVFDHWVGKARANDDPSSIKRLGVDETSSKEGAFICHHWSRFRRSPRHSCHRGQGQTMYAKYRPAFDKERRDTGADRTTQHGLIPCIYCRSGRIISQGINHF